MSPVTRFVSLSRTFDGHRRRVDFSCPSRRIAGLSSAPCACRRSDLTQRAEIRLFLFPLFRSASPLVTVTASNLALTSNVSRLVLHGPVSGMAMCWPGDCLSLCLHLTRFWCSQTFTPRRPRLLFILSPFHCQMIFAFAAEDSRLFCGLAFTSCRSPRVAQLLSLSRVVLNLSPRVDRSRRASFPQFCE
jgi:hypothetical protein